MLSECVGGDRTALEIRPPIGWSGRQDHILTLLANEHFAGAELELFRQPHGLAAIVHEHLGSSLHGRIPPWIDAVYISICHMVGSVEATPLGVRRRRVKTSKAARPSRHLRQPWHFRICKV